MSTYATRCAAIRSLLADGLEHSGAELERVGGRRYGARVAEIRRGEDGGPPIAVDCEVRGSESYWRARPYRDDEPRPEPKESVAALKQRIEQLEAELAAERKRRGPQLGLFEATQGG